eukprot:scaffold35515_cov17-Tisochrysis_lutea.AAC.1
MVQTEWQTAWNKLKCLQAEGLHSVIPACKGSLLSWQGSSSHPPSWSYGTILLGVAGGTYTPHTLGPLEELGLDTHTATKLALKLHAHSVQYADIHASTRRALDKTPLNSHHRDQARAIASNPSDPH